MANKKAIIGILCAIVILLVIGILIVSPMMSKESTNLTISHKTSNAGDTLAVKLIDSNGNPISNETVNVTIKNDNDTVAVNKNIKTNSKGDAELDLNLKKGKYSVNVTYGGNENYAWNCTTKNLTINDDVKSVDSEQSNSSNSDSDGFERYSPQYGTYIRHYTDSNGIQHIEGANGLHESYDPSTGIFTSDDGKGHVDKSRMC